MPEFILMLVRFAILVLVLACLLAYRSRANYEHWAQKRRNSYLTVARQQLSMAESAFVLGRLSLLAAVVIFLLCSLNR